MKILVTGGAGFIASHIVDKYLNLGHQVVIVDNLSSGKKANINQNAIFYETDIQDRNKIEEIFANEKPEVLNHHAAQMDVRKSVADPVYDANVNVVGILNLLEAGKKYNLKKVIFASTGGAIYGDADVIPTPETYNLHPVSPYGISKLVSEHYLNFYHNTYGINYAVLRYGNVYGPRQNSHGEAGVVAIFTQRLLHNEQVTIYGDGKQTRDFVFVDDIVLANVAALNSERSFIVNIGTGKPTMVEDIFKNIQQLTAATIGPDFSPARPGEQKRSCLDITASKKILNWEPKVDLFSGLKQTVESFQNEKKS